MGTGTILKLLMTVILTAASLSACSLDQRGQDGLVRIQLNTRAHSGGPSRLGTLTGGGMAAPTAISYYVIDVEGEGIPRQVIEPTKCVKASPTSSAMVPALLQAGEAERTELELLVPVGANRKIKIVRVDLSLPAGSSSPQFGESPFQFKMRNPGHTVSGDMFVLAEATIPFLNGDQSVTLTEKAVPEAIPNLCQAQGNNQPPIANADVELLNYEPWEGLGPNGQINPYRAWNNTPHYLMVRGEVKNKGASPLGFPIWPTPSYTPSATLGGLGIGLPNGYFSRQTFNSQERAFYQWVFPNYSPAPTGTTPSQLQITLPYSGGSSASIVHSFPWVMHSTPAPISSPVVSQVAGYANLYKARLDFTRSGSVIPVRPYGSLYSAVNTQYDLSPVEASGTLGSFTSETGATALALDPAGTMIFVATPTKLVSRYNFNQSTTTAINSVTLSVSATALLVVGTKVLIADQTQAISAIDYTSASPSPVPVYDGGTGAAFKGMVLDSVGGLVLSDSARHVLLRLTPTQLNSALAGTSPAPGSATLLAGEVGTMGNVDGPLLPTARFKNPGAMARDASGNILLVDGGNMSIRRVVVGGSVTTLPSPVAAFAYGNPSQIAMSGDSVLVSDSSRHVVYRIPPSGGPEVLVGKYGSTTGSATDGLLLEDSALSTPSALAVDSSGAIFIGDSNKVKRAMASCPVQKDTGGVSPRPFNAGKGCEFFYRVYNGSAFVAATNHPILKLGLSDGSGLEGYFTPQLTLAGHTYPSGYVGQGNDLVYNPTLGSVLTVTQTFVSALGGVWSLPSVTGNAVTIERVSIRSDAGTSTNAGMVTLSDGTLVLSSRMVNGAPIRELEILVKSVSNAVGSIAFYKQRFSFVPVIPANTTSRLSVGVNPVNAGFEVSTQCNSWQIQAYFQGRPLPVASGSLATFGGNTYSATLAGVISFTPATVGTLSITNAVAKYKSLDGDVGAPAASWSGTVVSSVTCTLSSGTGATFDAAN